ncbi:MAG: hypothetical protein J0H25_20985 [Rhizobiales bacterium]|nr:hypothetical protein [Hyphomicrobiales bacterium]
MLLKLLPIDVVLVEFFRHALFEAGNAFGENRLAVSRQLLLGVEYVEHIGRIEAARAASGQHARYGDQDGDSDQAM